LQRTAADNDPVVVPTEGLEPAHLAAHGPEPCASTNSATWALVLQLLTTCSSSAVRARRQATILLLLRIHSSIVVPSVGLEPPHLAAHGPEPCASTKSATWALLLLATEADTISGFPVFR